jgi:TRAP-type mannitol/chloroaromatic compound transport system permease small subunit
MSRYLIKTEYVISRITLGLGYLAAALLVLLLGNVFYDVVMRYLLHDVSIAMQELEWHLFATVFLLGVAYTLQTDGHVRVDLLYEKLSPQNQAWINLVGTLLFTWPFCAIVTFYGIDFAYDAYQIGEISGDPGGLTHRWLIKGMISLAFSCVLLSSLGVVLRAWQQILRARVGAIA